MSAIHNINGTTTPEAFHASHKAHEVVIASRVAVCRSCRVYQPLTPAPAPAPCTEHPAYAADYCPTCGTATTIGGKA